MWVYLNNNGIPSTRIPHGEVIRQRGSFNIYIAFEKSDFKVNGLEFESEVALLSYLKEGNFVTTIHFKRPSEPEFNDFRYIDEDHISIKTFKKTHDSEVTYDLVDGKRYVVYSFHGEPDLIDEYGNYEASITFYQVNGEDVEVGVQEVHNILKTGNIKFYVEKTYGEAEPNKAISISQYDYLLNYVKSIPRLDRQLSEIGVFHSYAAFARECCRQSAQDATPRMFLGYIEESSTNAIGIVQYFDENEQNITIYSSNSEDLVHFYDKNGYRQYYYLKNINTLEADIVKVWSMPSDDYDAVNKKHLDDNFYNKTEIDDSNVAFSQEITEKFEENKKYTDEKVSVKADKTELFNKDYNDLTNKPVIPERVSELEDDINIATVDYVQLVKKEIPTKTSQLENDSGFADASKIDELKKLIPTLVSQLENDADFADKTFVKDLVSRIPKFEIVAVDELPTENISTTTLYLLKTNTEEGNSYEEYVYINNNWELLGTTKINLEGYAKVEDIPTKVSELENDAEFVDKTYADAMFERLNTNTALIFYCVEPVTVVVNGESTTYPANSNVEVDLLSTDEFEIIPTSDNSILSLSSFPGAISEYYSWLEGVKQFSNILFDMNTEEMYTKWNQNNQGLYQVQFAQYVNCIFWSDNPYINPVATRTNYTIYQSSQLPLCYSTIRENTYKPFYLAYGVQSDPNWSNDAYLDSYELVANATQTFSYYGARTIGLFNLGVKPIKLPKDCRGLMFYSWTIESAGTFDAARVTSINNFGAKRGSWQEAFGNCYSLKFLYIKNLNANLNLSWSPIERVSLNYIINNSAATKALKIWVSPYTYYQLTADDIANAASKNITIILETANTIEDKRVMAINIKGDGTKVFADDGTYKPLPTKTSELTNDSGFLTEHQSLENYVTKDEAFSGDYNDLTNTPDVFTKSEIQEQLTRQNIISIIGKASQTLDGIMSKEDKQHLDAVVALLEEDDNDIVDKINEVLAIFNQYPEGAELVTVLSQKQDKLFSGINIKTINNESLLGEGNIVIEAGETLIENESLTTVAVGGIAKGVSLKDKSVVEVLESIFFPYVAFSMGNMSSSPGAGTVVEKGTSKTVNSITQPITLGSKKLTSLKLYKGSTLLQEKTSNITSSNTFSSLAQSLTATTTFKVEATDGTTSLSKSLNVFTFVDPYFYGILDTNATPASADITNKTKAVASKGNKTYSFTCTAKFPFVAYPASYGNLKSILDGNGFENLTDFTKHTVTLAVTSGNVSYNIYIKNSAATVTNFAYTFKY